MEVAKRIMAGDYKMVSTAGWGFLDRFFFFMKAAGFMNTLDVDGAGYVRQMITVARLILTYETKALLGIGPMNQVPDQLFKDVGLLLVLGYTAEQISNGFCRRGKQDKQGPMHKNTLADCVQRLTEGEAMDIVNSGVKLLAKHGMLNDSIYILDGSKLPTTETFRTREGDPVSYTSVTHTHHTRNGEEVEIVERIYGYKLLAIRGVGSRSVVASKVVPINVDERHYAIELIRQAEENIGRNRIKLLLIDRGYIDGLLLWKLKHECKLDFVIPTKTDMAVTKDVRGFRALRKPKGISEHQEGELKVWGIPNVRSYDQYGDEAHQEKNFRAKGFRANPLNAIMVLRWKGEDYEPGEEKVFITTLPVDKPKEVLEKYQLRSLIENQCFRELKQGWNLLRYPKRTEGAVVGHVQLTIAVFNMTNGYRTQEGDDLTEQGIRRFRRESFSESLHKVIVIAGEHFAIFDLEELMVLSGNPPQCFLRIDPTAVRKRYRIPKPETEAA